MSRPSESGEEAVAVITLDGPKMASSTARLVASPLVPVVVSFWGERDTVALVIVRLVEAGMVHPDQAHALSA